MSGNASPSSSSRSGPTGSSSRSGGGGAPRPKSFVDQLNAWGSAWKSGREASAASSSKPLVQTRASDADPSGTEASTSTSMSHLALPTTRWETAAWKGSSFPQLGDEAIQTLWAADGQEGEQVRGSVKKAVEEMELNWNLDPCLLGERSESNKGAAAIVSLLHRLAVASALQGNASGNKKGKILGEASAGKEGEGAADGSKDVKGAAATSVAILKPAKQYERHDLLRAIERQDHATILEIRNYNFDLLIDSVPGTVPSASASSSVSGGSGAAAAQTPLGYAISLGKGWESTAIVITGALSKFVNSLPDPIEEEEAVTVEVETGKATSKKKKAKQQYDEKTMGRLRKLRGNLKLAVDHSVATDQTGLLSSYIQVLFMSSGQSFIDTSTASLQTSIRSLLSSGGASGSTILPTSITGPIDPNGNDPVTEARNFVLQFVNEGLKKRERGMVASVGDLVDNAAGDLVLMALWDLVKLPSTTVSSLVYASIDEEDLLSLSQPLPSYAFARDDRMTRHFCQRLTLLQRILDDDDNNDESTAASQGTTAASLSIVKRKSEYKRARNLAHALVGADEDVDGGSGRSSTTRLNQNSSIRMNWSSHERLEMLRRGLTSRRGGTEGGTASSVAVGTTRQR